jgi:hypothetical protein
MGASLRAVDGAVTNDVPKQLADLPSDATHLVLSVGGNDLLTCAGDLLRAPVNVSSDAFSVAGSGRGRVRIHVPASRGSCLATGLPLVVCTIYDGNFADREFQTMAGVGVMAFNDRILRFALEKGLRSVDLRLICTQAEDYANPIEPSAVGGAKIGRAIWHTISCRLGSAYNCD